MVLKNRPDIKDVNAQCTGKERMRARRARLRMPLIGTGATSKSRTTASTRVITLVRFKTGSSSGYRTALIRPSPCAKPPPYPPEPDR